MADPLSIASAIISVTSLASSIAATSYSSVYESQRTLRELRKLSDELDKLGKCLHVLSDDRQSGRAPSKALGPAERECRTLLQGTASAVAGLPSGIREMKVNYESIALARCLEPIEAHCRQQTKYTPIFWRLQSWIMRFFMDRLPSSAHRLSTIPSIQHPTPRGLLLSWIILAVGIATFYRSRAGFRYEAYYIVGSIVLACVIGMSESSDVATVILMDIPWCLTIGMLLHVIVCGTRRKLRARRIQWNEIPCVLSPTVLSQDIEKMAGKE